ncbi:hypothetical protein [Sporichthya sp.]|uniref:hypothetical protein n=1 Tax=Sporichthya sp. TaxID=65475 RepID=UPI0025DDB05C|nr:hypothetical protein [Sporichthya sp.]
MAGHADGAGAGVRVEIQIANLEAQQLAESEPAQKPSNTSARRCSGISTASSLTLARTR